MPWLQLFQLRKQMGLLALPALGVLLVDVLLAPGWFSPRLDDFGPQKLIIFEGQELVLQGFSPKKEDSPVLSCETLGELDIDLTFDRAILVPASAETLKRRLKRKVIPQDLQEIRYLARAEDKDVSGVPCQNSFILRTDRQRPPQDLHLSRPAHRVQDQFRPLDAWFSEGNLIASLEAPLLQYPPGLGCRKRLQYNDDKLDFTVPFNYQLSVAGGGVQLRLERLSSQARFCDLWSPVRARAVTIRETTPGHGPEIVIRGRGSEATIEVVSLSLEADRMQVEVKGEGSMSGRLVHSFAETFRKRQGFVGIVMLLLLAMHGGIAAFVTIWVRSRLQEPRSSSLVQVVVSYSRKDGKHLEEVIDFIKGIEQVEFWWDDKMKAGTEWEESINKKIELSDIVLLLVSQSFLDSVNCKREVAFALSNRKILVPIILSPCEWRLQKWLRKVNLRPSNNETIEEHYIDSGRRKRLFLKIRQDICEHAEEIRAKRNTWLSRLRFWLSDPDTAEVRTETEGSAKAPEMESPFTEGEGHGHPSSQEGAHPSDP